MLSIEPRLSVLRRQNQIDVLTWMFTVGTTLGVALALVSG